MESAGIGLLAGRFAALERHGQAPVTPPPTTALGALLAHITGGANAETFQPMNVTFGLFPELPDALDERGRPIRGRERKQYYAQRARIDLAAWMAAPAQLAAQ